MHFPAVNGRAWRLRARSILKPNSSFLTNRRWACPCPRPGNAWSFVAGIKAAGKSAIFIDHNIFHVYPVVDRIVVLDRGTIAGQFLKNEVTLDELIDRMYTRVARTGSLDGDNQRPEQDGRQVT